jgi:glycosyltransferase involved in cell wall biosynthesis
MSKTLVLIDQQDSKWISVNPIKENLVDSYRALKVKVDFVHLDFENMNGLHKDLTEYHSLVLIESGPLHIKGLSLLLKMNKRKFKIFIHLYGDFSLNLHHWKKIESELGQNQICFLCASIAQKKLVNEFIPNASTVLLPFCINSADFYPKNWQGNTQNSVFEIVLSGRFSTQKNTLLTLIWTLEYFKKKKQKIRITFVGKFDDMGVPQLGYRESFGLNYFLWKEVVQGYEHHSHLEINFVPHLEKTELNKLYQKMDLFISLSTYHDEDFGMAPLESLFCGTKAILTNWGGYASYDIDRSWIGIVSVGFNGEGLHIDRKSFENYLRIFSQSKVSMDERYAHFFAMDSLWGMSVTTERLEHIIKQQWPIFKRFKVGLDEMASKVELYKLRQQPIFSSISCQDLDYYKMYRHYVGSV